MRSNEQHTSNKTQLFGELVHQHQSSVFAFIRSIGVTVDAVEDVAQEAFLVAYKKFDQFDVNKASFFTWICGIARHLFMNDKRKQVRRSLLQNKVISDMLLKLDAPFGEHHKDELQLLSKCLNLLDPQAQQMLKDRYENDKKSHRIALEAGKKPAAIRQQLVRLRSILKKCVGDKLI
jgi:RNA polymerase sigma-70 factor, ECF subfamily